MVYFAMNLNQNVIWLLVGLLHEFIFDLVNKTIYAHLHFTFFTNI